MASVGAATETIAVDEHSTRLQGRYFTEHADPGRSRGMTESKEADKQSTDTFTADWKAGPVSSCAVGSLVERVLDGTWFTARVRT